MDAMTALLTRRSIRKYTADPVSDELVEELIRAAMYAPSAGNRQPWHFIVIRDRAILDAIPAVHPYSKMILEAPLAILVCAEPALARNEGLWVQDCSAATQNLLLAAHAKGLGAVWLGVHPYEDRVAGIRRVVGLPEDIQPLSLIPLGYPAEEKPQPERFDGAKIRKDRWGA